MKTYIVTHYNKTRNRVAVYVVNAESVGDAESLAGFNKYGGETVTSEVPMGKKGVVESVWIPDPFSAQLV
jgi:hypothetical protein